MRYPSFIKAVDLSNRVFDAYKANDSKIDDLSKVNIFIGANNSGKSRFLRTLFAAADLRYTNYTFDIEKYNSIIENLEEGILTILSYHHLSDIGSLGKHRSELRKIDFLGVDLKENPLSKIFKYIHNVLSPNDGYAQANANYYVSSVNTNSVIQQLRALSTQVQPTVEFTDDSWNINFERIYIPTLRGLRKINFSPGGKDYVTDNTNSYYIRTNIDYFNENKQAEVYTGLEFYEMVKDLLLGSRDEREKLAQFEVFLSESFFDNKQVSIIPHRQDDVVHIRIGEDEFPIYNLGDGIQALIILTYPLFFNIGKTLQVFIEEPEHYLHPAYQRLYIETLLRPEFKHFQYFITSHSNHLLDITLDIDNISVYTFNRERIGEQNQFLIENVENDCTNVLELLGVKNSSVFLSNCTIWVEGITDRIYLRQYLKVYQDKQGVQFKEDLHYSFVEYGGNNITHWSFLDSEDETAQNIVVERLCGRLFLVTDSDNAGLNYDGAEPAKVTKKFSRFKQLIDKLGERYYCLKSREIENSLSPQVLLKVIGSYEKKDNPLEYWIELDLQHNDYRLKSLGKYINDNIPDITRSYQSASGTINDKVLFAKRAVHFITDINDLTDDALEVTQKIYDFIKQNNH